jgi:hypothetical protein
MTRMLESVQACGMEDGNKGRIKREGKNKVLFRQNIHTVPMTVAHKIFKQGLQK